MIVKYKNQINQIQNEIVKIANHHKMTQDSFIASIEKEEKMISNLIKSMAKYNRFIMLSNLLIEFKNNITLQKERISFSAKHLFDKFLTPQNEMHQNSKNIKIDYDDLMKTKSELSKLMSDLDETMNDYHSSYASYERSFISEKILEDIASYHKSEKNKSLKEQIKKIRYSVYLKRKRYDNVLREYNSRGKKLLNTNVINF